MPSYGMGGGNTSNAQKSIDANNAKYQAEAQAYANSKGISIPSDFAVMSSMVVLPTSSYYKAVGDVARKRDTARDREYASKTPQYAVDQYVNNKNQFFQTLIGAQAKKAIFQKNLPIMGQDLQKYIKYAASAGVPASIVNTAIKQEQDAARGSSGGGLGGFFNDVFGGVGDIVTSAYQSVSNTLAKAEDVVKKEVLPNPIFQIAMAYYMPGIASSLAPSLATLGVSATYQAAVANAITSITLQVAQGVPLEKAIQTATINAVVSTGSQTAATELNNVIKNPAITDAIVSAGSSAAKTALNGGSKEDIERNLLGGLLGSATASSTGSTVAGSAVGGGVTGGVLGALTGAAGALGKPEDKSTKTTDAGTSTDPGIQVAGGDDATALNMASISAMPEMLGKSGETASALSPVVEEGQTFYERTITGKTPDGKEYSYTVSYDPNAPVGKQISYTTSGMVQDAEGNLIPGGGGFASATFKRPDFTAATTTGTYTPTIITPDGTISTGGTGGTTGVGAGSTPVSPAPVTPTPVSPDKPILDLIAPTSPTTQPVTPSPVTPVSPAPTTPIAEPITSEKPVVTPPKEPEVIPPVEPTTPEKPVVEAITPEETTTPEEKAPPEELPPVEDKTGTPVPYKPNIYTYGGTSPDVLARTLNAPFYPQAGTTGGLTSARGAGEIESKETGKKRKNVWNEASLRLKDALGV